MSERGKHRKRASDPKETVKEGYNQVADAYARLEDDTTWPRLVWLQKVLDRLAPGAHVLDLGCGDGLPAGPRIVRAHRLTGVDISEAQIVRALSNIPDASFVQGDLATVPFAPGSFDAVLSFYTLEHVPRDEHADIFRMIHRWLAPGGLFLCSMEAADYDDLWGEWLGVPMFLSCFAPEITRRLLRETGFEILETAIEDQAESGTVIPYHWILACRS